MEHRAPAWAGARSAESAFLLAVSEGPDPRDPEAWHRLRFDADPGDVLWADFPNIGFNDDWIVITVVLADVFVEGQEIHVLDKALAYAGDPAPTLAVFDRTEDFTIFAPCRFLQST